MQSATLPEIIVPRAPEPPRTAARSDQSDTPFAATLDQVHQDQARTAKPTQDDADQQPDPASRPTHEIPGRRGGDRGIGRTGRQERQAGPGQTGQGRHHRPRPGRPPRAGHPADGPRPAGPAGRNRSHGGRQRSCRSPPAPARRLPRRRCAGRAGPGRRQADAPPPRPARPDRCSGSAHQPWHRGRTARDRASGGARRAGGGPRPCRHGRRSRRGSQARPYGDGPWSGRGHARGRGPDRHADRHARRNRTGEGRQGRQGRDRPRGRGRQRRCGRGGRRRHPAPHPGGERGQRAGVQDPGLGDHHRRQGQKGRSRNHRHQRHRDRQERQRLRRRGPAGRHRPDRAHRPGAAPAVRDHRRPGRARERGQRRREGGLAAGRQGAGADAARRRQDDGAAPDSRRSSARCASRWSSTRA